MRSIIVRAILKYKTGSQDSQKHFYDIYKLFYEDVRYLPRKSTRYLIVKQKESKILLKLNKSAEITLTVALNDILDLCNDCLVCLNPFFDKHHR